MISIIRFIETITRAVGYTAALVVIPLALGVSYEVFARYFFGAPTIWAFELGYTLMGVHFLLGGALTLQKQAHVRIDLIYARLSPRMRAVLDLTLYLVLILPCLYLISDRLIEYASSAYQSGERSGNSAWNPVIWPFRAIIAFSFVLLLLQVIAECLKAVRAIFGRADYPETPAATEQQQ
ncbi:TRAP transporter small permease subunit [Dichotomicrobium thermohalophilum]|uniref:TRAP transporter small permease protein n=1 Tax=Dichotomicrobium thermohalophilum TaxID=933063 RepID=A0A397PDU2_9HYPH|nr:TRAP transporter small permease subunit [Dichotomicrobium thermohalophilum]RIA47670.1 TRAP-type mannitol/chloroaromatic compound transport system permease small subunit [Dichotomicrobium thermohalophilum]